MMIQLITVPITTDAGGDFSASIVPQSGRLLQYRYVPDGTAPLATGADLTIAGATTGYPYVTQADIGTSAFIKSPRQATHDLAGVALDYAAAGSFVEDYVYVSGEKLDVTIAQGGNAKAGTLYVWVG